jgi:phosphoribosyl-ATP pyrophosphohydrolase/phosphoribosyl-AMP cyclohydrolase/histidinol dehydrogenase
MLRRTAQTDVPGLVRVAVDSGAREIARKIVTEVRLGGEQALRKFALEYDRLDPDAPLFFGRDALLRAHETLDSATLGVLERTAERIEAFARAQRGALRDVDLPIPGGVASHRFVPLNSAGCYAPGGRHPLPSSVLMTALVARVAGVAEVWVASPDPTPATLAAAAIAGASGLVAAGGAQAIAALAYGAGPVPDCDVIVGPGNKYVTAAKELISRDRAIDMLAGPSELLIVADGTADPLTVAADLLGQAEHDDEAVPMLIALPGLDLDAVDAALQSQLAELPTAATARRALDNGFAVAVESVDDARALCERLAPEHLQLSVADAPAFAERLTRYGALFVGENAAEVLGDYGAGPNHVLPTGGSARTEAGLSVLTFLRARTQLRIDTPGDARALVDDAVALARIEGLEAHARAAERRRITS